MVLLIFLWIYVILHCSRESIPFGRPLSSFLSAQTYFLKQFSKLLLINIVALVYRGALLKDLQLSHEFRNIVVHKRDLTLFTNNQSKWILVKFFLLILNIVWTAFCKIFSGTPHLTIFCAPKYTKYAKYAFLAHIWARQIWSSGVSLKRSCKMQFRHVGLGQ